MKKPIQTLVAALVAFGAISIQSLRATEDHDHRPVTVPVAGSVAEAWKNAQDSVKAMTAGAPAKQQQVMHDEQEKLVGALMQLQEKTVGAADKARLEGAIKNAIAASERVHVASDAGDWAKVESTMKTLQATMALLEKQLPAEAKQPSHEHAVPSSTIKSEIVSPAEHSAGKSSTTLLRLTDSNGQPVSLDALQVAHTEKIHLLIVDETLTDYHHEHPVAGEKPGEYRFEFSPRFGGNYQVWADVVPAATGRQEYARTEIKVQGPAAKKDRPLNTTAESENYRFSLTTENNEKLQTGKPTMVTVKVTAPDGTAFTGLEPVMGAFAHMVAFPDGLASVMHIHPMGKEPATPNERSGPELSFHVEPEKAGFHKMFLQVQIGGREVYAAFGVHVEPGSAPTAVSAKEFTCPMHPEVLSDKPGKCPKCGMALVAK